MNNDVQHVVSGSTPKVISRLFESDGTPVDLSHPSTSVLLKIRKTGSDEVVATLPYTKLTGRERANRVIDEVAPYDVPGRGGRCSCLVPSSTFEIGGPCSQGFQGEVVALFGSGSEIRKVYQVIEFIVRKGF